MKKKMKFKGRRYAYGGPTDDGDGAMMTPTYDSPSEDSTSATPAIPAAEQSFGQAFKAARKTMLAGGDKTFMYKGKSYNTNLASDKKPVDKSVYRPTDGPQKRFLVPKKERTPSTSTSTISAAKPAAEQDDGSSLRNKDIATGVGMGAATVGAVALGKKFRLLSRIANMFKGRVPSATKLLTNEGNPVDTKLLTYQSGLRKGGSVKSSASKGGSVKSSASSRADGIAQRGKTRGRNC